MRRLLDAVVLWALFTPIAVSAGGLDTSFGNGGQLFLGAGTGINSAVLQSDGKSVFAGYQTVALGMDAVLLVRLLPNGGMDPSFGMGGRVQFELSNASERAAFIALQSDGRLVIAACVGPQPTNPVQRCPGATLIRVTTNGDLDPTFGVNGRVIDPTGKFLHLNAIAIQRDGRIVVVGDTSGHKTIGRDTDIMVMRLNVDGTLDATFGVQGSVALDWQSLKDSAADLALQSDGKILIAGEVEDMAPLPNNAYGPSYKCAVLRLLSDGSLDPGFGAGGWLVFLPSGAIATADRVLILADGQILVAGEAAADYLDGPQSPEVSRLTAAGELDSSYGAGARLLPFVRSLATPDTPFEYFGVPSAATAASDGSLWIAGARLDSQGNLGLAKINADGNLASLSDQTAIAALDAGPANALASDVIAHAILTSAPQRLLVAGTAQTRGGGESGVVLDYRTDDPPAGTIGFTVSGLTWQSGGASTVTLMVQRSGGSSGSVNVAYTTVDDTALASADYTAMTGQISWADGDSTDRHIIIAVTGTTVPAGSSRDFGVKLSQSAQGNSLGISAATVTLDNPKAQVIQPVSLPASGLPPSGGGGVIDAWVLIMLFAALVGLRTGRRISLSSTSIVERAYREVVRFLDRERVLTRIHAALATF